MKNKEKYADQIKTADNQCVISQYYQSENCENYDCEGCLARFFKWLEEEAKPEKKQFSADELAIMKSINTKFNFIARDENGSLFVYMSMPLKNNAASVWFTTFMTAVICRQAVLSESIPHENYDRRMNIVVTEETVRYINSSICNSMQESVSEI